MWTSSSSSSSSTSLSSSAMAAARPRTMKEVWKDITLSADLRRRPPSPGVILQDFFSRDPPSSSVSPHGFSPSPPPPPPPPPTMLTLNSGSDRFGPLLLHPPYHQIHGIPHISASFDAVVPDDGGGGGGNKRFPEFERGSGDRRHKRMIKNRESAARSRARKQAYTNELEQEVANLLEENARLKKQQEELHRAASAAENVKRKPLHRTSTAPF